MTHATLIIHVSTVWLTSSLIEAAPKFYVLEHFNVKNNQSNLKACPLLNFFANVT